MLRRAQHSSSSRSLVWCNAEINIPCWTQASFRIDSSNCPSLNENGLDADGAKHCEYLGHIPFMLSSMDRRALVCLPHLPNRTLRHELQITVPDAPPAKRASTRLN